MLIIGSVTFLLLFILVGWAVGWFGLKFLKGREISLACSYRSSILHSMNPYIDIHLYPRSRSRRRESKKKKRKSSTRRRSRSGSRNRRRSRSGSRHRRRSTSSSSSSRSSSRERSRFTIRKYLCLLLHSFKMLAGLNSLREKTLFLILSLSVLMIICSRSESHHGMTR